MLTKLKIFYNTHNKSYLTILGIGFVFLLWFIISISINNALFPNPGAVFPDLGLILSKGDTWAAIGGTMLRLVISFAISFVLALIFGYLGGRFKGFYKFFNPLIITLRTLPTAAIIFVLVVLTKPMYALVIIVNMLMFPILYEAVATGVRNVEKGAIEAMKVDSGYTLKSIWSVVLPMAWPSIGLGIIQSIGLGMKVGIMSEVLCGSDTIPGLGRMLYHGYYDANITRVFSVAIIAIILIGINDVSVNYIKKKKVNK